MAELLLKVGTRGPDPDWQDGDILVAPNDRRISQVHLEHFCHVRRAGLTRDGRRPDGLARIYREAVYQYRFDRVSNTVIRRTDLWTGDEQLFSDVPRVVDGQFQHIHVSEFITRALDHSGHGVFGTPGAEIWYGGLKDFAASKLDHVWPEVEDREKIKRADYSLFPWGAEDLKQHLVLKVDDFDDARVATMLAEDRDKITNQTIRRRTSKVDWRTLDLGVDARDIDDPIKAVDIRASKSFLCVTVVLTKMAIDTGKI